MIVETIQFPDRVEQEQQDNKIAQKELNKSLVLRVVYREHGSFILTIAVYLGMKSRYEKN